MEREFDSESWWGGIESEQKVWFLPNMVGLGISTVGGGSRALHGGA